MGLVRYAATLAFIIAVPVALITTNVRILINAPALYEYATDHYDTTATTGIERDELLRASGELRDYFNNGEDEIFVRVQKDGDPIRLFDDQETAHLRDVKTLLVSSFRVQEVSVMFVLAYVVAVFIWARENSLRTLARQLFISGALSLAVLAGVGGLIAAGFDSSFEQFHVIAFDNDFWRLDSSRQALIQMFPNGFWQDVTLWAGIATAAELSVLALLSLAYLRLTRHSPGNFTLAAGAQA